MKKILILDTDVGTDDAAAIMLLAKKGIVVDYTVATGGNTDAARVLTNIITLKKYFGFDTTAVKGLPPADDVNAEKSTFHGSDGLADIADDMSKGLGIDERDFSDYISFDTFCERISGDCEITYIAIGPLTNLVYLLENEKIKSNIMQVYIMGGGIGEFNCANDSEFNFSQNPAAAEKVLSSGLCITLFPLDLTNHQAWDVTKIDALEKYGVYPEYITFFRFDLVSNRVFNGKEVAILHDCMPVLYYENKGGFTVKDMKLTVDKYGATKVNNAGYPIKVAVKAPKDMLFSEMEKIFKDAVGK